MRTRTLLLPCLAVALALSCLAPSRARAESPQQAAQRLRVDAQFDRARANEFRKFANEDEGVARARMAQATDLNRNADQYEQRAQFHQNLANQFNNQDQRELAQACRGLAGDMRKLAQERQDLATKLQAHVSQWRAWATNLDQRAQRAEAWANQLQTAGSL